MALQSQDGEASQIKHWKSKITYTDYTLSGSMIQFYVPKYFFSSEKFTVKTESYAPALYFLSSLQFCKHPKETHLECPGTRIKTTHG